MGSPYFALKVLRCWHTGCLAQHPVSMAHFRNVAVLWRGGGQVSPIVQTLPPPMLHTQPHAQPRAVSPPQGSKVHESVQAMAKADEEKARRVQAELERRQLDDERARKERLRQVQQKCAGRWVGGGAVTSTHPDPHVGTHVHVPTRAKAHVHVHTYAHTQTHGKIFLTPNGPPKSEPRGEGWVGGWDPFSSCNP